MPTTPSPAQSEASRLNGARSSGPATDAGKARSALNGVRHGLCGRTFFLLPDEDPAEFHGHEAMWLAVWKPRDLHEHEAAGSAIRAMWREIRADRLEAAVLTDLFAAGEIADDAERQAAKAAAMKALGTLLRYRGRIEREHGGHGRPRRPAPAPPRPAIARATTRTRAAAGSAHGRWPARGCRPHPGHVSRPLDPTRARSVDRSRSRAAERTRAAPQPAPAPRARGHGPPRRLTPHGSVAPSRALSPYPAAPPSPEPS